MLDSGASRHMTYWRDIFTEYAPYRTAIRIANGQRIWSEGKGNILISIDGTTIRMTDVLYVPRLDANLLSISALNKKRLNVLFHPNGVDIMREGIPVASGILQGRTYFLRSSQVALKAHSESVKDLTRIEEAEYRLWHARMGHPSPKHLRELHRFASGIITFPLDTTHLSCTVCNFTKLTRIVSRTPFTWVSKPLAWIHTDIWGPYRTPSLGKHLYFISLIDDHTQKSWLICLKTRQAIYRGIKDWIAVIEREASCQVIKFRCDNAKEYQKFIELIRSDGIRAEPTTPYTTEQNGVAECYNRTIVQIVRSMLTWANLPHSFWGEAAMTANYLRNLLPTTTDDRSPEEQWTQQKLDVSHLRTFGCLVHVHIPKENRAKLDRVSWQGIFVRYHSTNQYRIYNPERRKVEWHTSVKFLEDTPGGIILGEKRREEDPESLMHPGTSNNDDDDSSDNEDQPDSD